MIRVSIGFTQRIQLEWLEWTAQTALAGLSESEIRAELQNRLRPIVSVGGDDQKSNRGKVVGILLKIWVKGLRELLPFRQEGLLLLAQLPVEEHLAIHWGMSLATYPYFGAVVEAVGRLLQLQGGVSITQVDRRIQEQYGQRTSIKRATQRAFYCLHDWGVLAPAEERTIYTRTQPVQITDPRLATWLVEATMISAGAQSVPMRSAAKSPMLFPYKVTLNRVDENGRLDIFRQGLDDEVIIRSSQLAS